MKTFFSAVQWLFFIFANTVVVPISIAAAFDLPAHSLNMMLSASLIFTGLASILQGCLGHRFPIMEGHSGLLWGVILNLGLSASTLGLSPAAIGGGIATGIILASIVTILLALFGGAPFLKAIFSPMVMSVYLFLLTFQLMFIFFKGMFPLGKDGTIDVYVSLFSLGIVLLVSVLKLCGKGLLSNFSILIGLLVGWMMYVLLFGNGSGEFSGSEGFAFTVFPLGKPNLEMGIVVVTFFSTMLNLANTYASISTSENLFNKKTPVKQYRNSILLTAVFTIVGSGFGLVPYTPFSSSIGFLQSTQIYQRKPFILGGGLLTIIGLIPALASFLATMPISVGNAVLFVAYLQLFGTAYHSLGGQTFNSNTIFRLAAPVLFGVSLMNMQPTVFSRLPVLIQPLITNGLIMGMLISILIEKVPGTARKLSKKVST